MNCGTCISAAYYMDEINLDYAASDPGKLKFFLIDWNASFTCASIISWASGLSCLTFLDGYDEFNYYGGMGMPTIVVLGGNDHHVYYNKLGYNNTLDNQDVRDAINATLGTETSVQNIAPIGLTNIYPNPASSSSTINYTLNTISTVTISIINLTGQKIKTVKIENQSLGKNKYELNTQALVNGIYIVEMSCGAFQKTMNLTVNH